MEKIGGKNTHKKKSFEEQVFFRPPLFLVLLCVSQAK